MLQNAKYYLHLPVTYIHITIIYRRPIYWYDWVRNDEVLQRTGLTSQSHLLSHWRISVFQHVARLDDDTPANMALQLHINVSLNWPPDRMWRLPPGRPRNKWLDQLRNDSIHPTGDLWRRAVDRGRWWCNDVTALTSYVTMMMMIYWFSEWYAATTTL